MFPSCSLFSLALCQQNRAHVFVRTTQALVHRNGDAGISLFGGAD